MKTRLVQVGRSKAVCIPSSLLEKIDLPDEVEITAVADSLVIKPTRRNPARKPRAGWSAAFARMRRNDDDRLLDAPLPSLTLWDREEWEW